MKRLVICGGARMGRVLAKC